MMKLTLKRADALAALNRVVGVIKPNPNVAILNNVMLETASQFVHWTGTDMALEATTRCEADVTDTGCVTVNADKLRQIVTNATGELSLSLDGDRLIVKSGRSRFSLPTLPGTALPIMKFEPELSFSMSGALLNDMLTRTVWAAGKNTTAVHLMGVFLHATATELRAGAISGREASYRSTMLPVGSAALSGVIIPTRAVVEFQKLLSDAKGDVTVSARNEKSIRIEAGETSVTAKVIEGQFPDYERTYPKENPRVMKVNVEAARAAVKRVMVAAEDNSRTIVLEISDGLMKVSARGETEASDEVEVGYVGETTRIGFNGAALLAVLTQMESVAVVRFSTHDKPTIWQSEDDEDGLINLMTVRA